MWNLEAVHKSLTPPPLPSCNFRNSWIYTSIIIFPTVFCVNNSGELCKIKAQNYLPTFWESTLTVCLSSDWGAVRRCQSFKLVQLPLATCNQCKTSNIISTCNILLNTIHTVYFVDKILAEWEVRYTCV